VFFGPGADGDIKLPSQETETRSQSGKVTGYRLNCQRSNSGRRMVNIQFTTSFAILLEPM
jgi:hypothetical protein